VDVPTIEQYDHYILQHGEDILITELSIAGLRDSMRIFDFINEKLGNKKITFVANKTGLNKKFETTVKDFETGLGRKIDFIIPFEQEIYGFANTGKIQVDDAKSSKFAAAIQKLAAKFLPDGIANSPEPAPKPKGFMSKFLKK
jgi:pilus assembly protein CpaE